MRVGCYSLDLYCDADSPDHAFEEFPHQFTAQDGGTCRRDARRDGWKLGRMHVSDDRDLCPKCSGKRPKDG